MTILVVSSWHEKPELLADQIESYNRAFDGDLIHVININANFAEKFSLQTEKCGIDFSKYGNVFFPKYNLRTAWGMIAHAYFNGVLDSITKGRRFEYVYFHTSSDLMIKNGINNHIKNHDIGFGRPVSYKYSILDSGSDKIIDVNDTFPPFREAMKNDNKLPKFLAAIGTDVMNKSRAEGCFFRRDIFFEIMYPLFCNYSLNDMENLSAAYPIEEYLWSICVEKFVARHKVRRARHVIMTSRNEKQRASIEDMAAVLADPQLFGIKRFGGLLDDPVRVHARQLLLSPPSP